MRLPRRRSRALGTGRHDPKEGRSMWIEGKGRILSFVLAVSAGSVLSSDQLPGHHDQSAWELIVLPIGAVRESGRPSLWVGVRNLSAQRRVFCADSLMYSVSAQAKELGGGTIWAGSPHACVTGLQKYLVLPG